MLAVTEAGNDTVGSVLVARFHRTEQAGAEEVEQFLLHLRGEQLLLL
ncbi:hypothetical protein [Streptomyces sp. NPDC057686]